MTFSAGISKVLSFVVVLIYTPISNVYKSFPFHIFIATLVL
jgi:hypothetical protein